MSVPRPRVAAAVVDPDIAALVAEIRGLPGVGVHFAEPMARHTTMRVGGPADILAVIHDTTSLVSIVRLARASGVAHVVLGRGSDLVVADAGMRGLVIVCRTDAWRIEGRLLVADAGLPLARAATEAARAGLAGLEFGLAIPGTVGGAVWANAGAHGSDVAAVLESVTTLDGSGALAAVPAAELRLAYRDSRLKREAGWGIGPGPATAAAGADPTTAAGPGSAAEVVLDATFRLAPARPAEIAARMTEIRRWRREHQPLGLPSAGSVFRNPPGESAGRLIDACGLKGLRDGGAEISPMHANFIVNSGGATAAGIRRLAEAARSAVRRRFGIDLEFEIQFVGEWPAAGLEER
jgi:UDP-N-acetylmuramate dehydrogenase